MTATATWCEMGILPRLRDALRSFIAVGDASATTWQLGSEEVAEGLAAVGELRQLLEIAEVALVREGVTRGLSKDASWSEHDWVTRTEATRAPAPETRHVARVLRVAKGARTSGLSAATGVFGVSIDELTGAATGSEPGETGSTAAVVACFEAGDLALGKADQLVRFEAQVSPVADPTMLSDDLSVLLKAARDEAVRTGPDGRRQRRVSGLTEKELGVAITHAGRLLKPAPDLEREDGRAKAGRSLVKSPGPAGMSSYRLVLDAEGASVVDAAISALSAPVQGPDGERDDRPSSRRRADALLEVVRRGVSSPGEAPKSDKAQVHVMIPLATLLEGVHGGGVTTGGEVLPPSVVRRMACDAGIVPVVLGGAGEVLELGRSVRLFTPGQRRAVWLRDGACTFPGCTVPAPWCDAHHVDWWSRGGGTDVANAALLCQRHHTRVHTRDLSATVTAAGVTWHL